MTLKGPADADAYRIKVGRFNDRWYTDPLPADQAWPATPDDEAYPSISTVKKASGQDWSFVSLKRVATELHGKPVPKGVDAAYASLKSINDLGLRSAQKRGTGVHAIAETYLKGYADPMATPNSDAEKYRPAVDAFFATYKPELVACEFVAFHRSLNGVGYGGTGDAALRFAIVDGLLAVVDWKSRGEDSDHGAYAEEAAQVAAYARADYWIVEGDRGPERITPPPMDTGLIVSIKPDGYRVYPIDLDKAFAHWTSMHAWWVARRTEKQAIGRPWAPRKVEECQPGIKRPTTSSSETPSEPSSTDSSTPPSRGPTSTATEQHQRSSPDRLDSIRARIRSLPPDAKPHLKRLWPADTPRGLQGPFTDEQLDRIAATLDTVEWEYTTKDFVVKGAHDDEQAVPGQLGVAVAQATVPSPRAAEPPDEGPDVDLTDVKARITALPKEQQDQFNTILVQSKDAGRNFHLLRNRGGMPSLRRVTIVNALVDAIEASDGDEELLRHMLSFALGEEVQPAVTLGCAVGSLTTLEAERLALLADALSHGKAPLLIGEDGVARFEIEEAA